MAKFKGYFFCKIYVLLRFKNVVEYLEGNVVEFAMLYTVSALIGRDSI